MLVSEQYDAVYERISMLFNVGLWYMKHSVKFAALEEYVMKELLFSCWTHSLVVLKTCTVCANQNKVTTTMMIRLLDNRTYCVRSAFTHVGFGESRIIVQGINSEPENALSSVLYLHFHRSPLSNHLAAI